MTKYADGSVTISLNVKKIKESHFFYSGLLGFKLVYELPQSEAISAYVLHPENNPNFRVCLVPKESDIEKKNEPIFNINLNECEKIYSKMKGSGIVFFQEYTSLPYVNYFICEDPDGNKIQISEFFPEMIDWDN